MSQVGWTHFPDNQYIYIYICLNIIRNPPTPEIPNSIYVWALIQKLLLPPPPPFARILLWFAPKTYLSLSLSNSVTYTYISSACYVLWRYPDSASNNHPLPPQPTFLYIYIDWHIAALWGGLGARNIRYPTLANSTRITAQRLPDLRTNIPALEYDYQSSILSATWYAQYRMIHKAKDFCVCSASGMDLPTL